MGPRESVFHCFSRLNSIPWSGETTPGSSIHLCADIRGLCPLALVAAAATATGVQGPVGCPWDGHALRQEDAVACLPFSLLHILPPKQGLGQ